MENSRASLYELRTKGIDKDRFAIERLIDPDSSILEVGCGTGRILKWLAARSHAQIIGIEVRGDFLAIAQEKLKDAPNIQLINEDFAQYQSKLPADYVLFAFNVFGEFDNADKRVEVLMHAKSLLGENGSVIIIYDIPSTMNEKESMVEYNFKIGTAPSVWDVSIVCQRNLGAQTSSCKVTYQQAGEVITDTYTQAHITRDELLATYKAAGLRLEKEYGSYTLTPFEHDSDVLIHVLK